ncbi:MAG: DUF3841 domain-containing protein [Clostridiales bacterium]|nr:DUF3841 domain-containing protein [Clostridiales bacterium]
MKLVTFQTIEALKELINNGYIECNEKYINMPKIGYAYNWITEKMNERILSNGAKYPIWVWVKVKNRICPPKVKGKPVKGFEVKITFNKPENQVFITDFRRYSFVLNNIYIPKDKKAKETFDNKLKQYNITKQELEAYVRKDKYFEHRQDKEYLNICKEIRNSFDRCITKESDILQGCVWRINLDEVEKIEILKEDGYTYGTLNYIRSNGKRFDWIEDYYKMLK